MLASDRPNQANSLHRLPHKRSVVHPIFEKQASSLECNAGVVDLLAQCCDFRDPWQTVQVCFAEAWQTFPDFRSLVEHTADTAGGVWKPKTDTGHARQFCCKKKLRTIADLNPSPSHCSEDLTSH